MNRLISIVFLLLIFNVAAARSGQIVTRKGVIYNGATVEKVDPDGLTISYLMSGGGLGLTKLEFSDLPDALQKKYGYNPTNAISFEMAERKAAGQWRAQMIANEDAAKVKLHSERLLEAIAGCKKSGTGFFITDNGYVLTCYHVVADTTHVTISTKDALYPAIVVRTDPDNDVALLKVEGSFHSLPFISSTNAGLGDSIFTIGFPVITLQGVEPKLTAGAINSLAGIQDDPREFQISAEVQPGNSGGPLVNEYGNVIGIVAARISDVAALEKSGMMPENVNYAVKSSRARKLLDSIPDILPKLKKPYPDKTRKFSDVVQETENGVVMVLAN